MALGIHLAVIKLSYHLCGLCIKEISKSIHLAVVKLIFPFKMRLSMVRINLVIIHNIIQIEFRACLFLEPGASLYVVQPIHINL